MATFVVKGYLAEPPPSLPCTGIFTDVPCTGSPYSPFAPYIEKLYNDGVTGGCGTGIFCPGNNVTAWQVMVWLGKAPTLPGGGTWATYRPVPRGSIYTLRDEQNRVVTEMAGGLSGSASATLAVQRDNVFLGSLLVASYANSAWTYSVSDHLGSIRAIWNAAGNKTEDHRYWPYGEDTNSLLTQHLGFQTMERNDGAAQYFDHARTQQYNLGRFVSPDQVGGKSADPKSWNRYAYSTNNPVNRVDPNGLTDVDIFVLREAQTERSTQGSFSIKGSTVRGRTLELRSLGNSQEVSRILPGTYPATREQSAKFGAVLRLHNVPGRSDILIHPGNTAADTKGCILVGSACAKDPDRITGSRAARNSIIEYIDSVSAVDKARGETTTIRVTLVDETGTLDNPAGEPAASEGINQPRLPLSLNSFFQTLSEQFDILRDYVDN